MSWTRHIQPRCRALTAATGLAAGTLLPPTATPGTASPSASTATALLDHSAMRDGDPAGLALLRDASAWIGVSATAA
jgi:hypothetical protein